MVFQPDTPIVQTDADIAAAALAAAQATADAAILAAANAKVVADNLTPRAVAKAHYIAHFVGLPVMPFENLGETDQVFWETHT